ncbi:BadF/BadG/BcrA/BcrD ATPase family protein [Acetobacter musti]|uniref:BadF/BadG/BcrA/BcrD ATPase family protein n=1 Tax=Acetobacter musti TaxID=864732 RepID=UPI0030CC1AFF
MTIPSSLSSVSGIPTLLAAIDGGATKTILRLALPDGSVIGEGRGGAGNIASDIDMARASVRTALDDALRAAGLSCADPASGAVRIFAGAGMAGAEAADCAQRFTRLCDDFAKLEVRSDSYTSCLGAHGGEDGAVIAVGTGSVAYAICGPEERRAGGWGFPQSDEGGGAWVGLEAIRHMLAVQDGRVSETGLSLALRAHLISAGHDPLSWSVGASATRFASLAPVLVKAAQAGDAAAMDILNRAGDELGALADSLLSENRFSALPLCLLGGLAPVLMPRLPCGVREKLVPAQGSAVDGAMMLARRVCGNPL